MPDWLNAVVGFATAIGASGLVGWLLSRKLNQEIARKARIETEAALDDALDQPREQAAVWYGRWQEEVNAREADRLIYRGEIDGLKRRVERLEAQLREHGLTPRNGH